MCEDDMEKTKNVLQEKTRAYYLCDPDKNKVCAKRSCWKNGGRCMYTCIKEFSKNGRIDVIVSEGNAL